MKAQPEAYFGSADALRATAILLVVLNHVFTFTRPALGNRGLEFGYLGVWGVNCFFLLSGCLLSGPYLRALLDPAKPWPSAREFYTRRFLRIYPLYLVSVLFTIAFLGVCVQAHFTTSTIASTVLMLQNFSPDTILAVSPPLWTMAVDAAFYIVLPPFAYLLARLLVRGPYRLRVATIALTFAMIVAGCFLYRVLAYATHVDALASFPISAVYVRNFAGMLTAFTLGATLALVRLVGSRRATLAPAYALSAIVAGVAIAGAELGLRLGLEKHAEYSVGAVLRAAIVDPLAAVSCALIFAGLALGDPAFALPIVRSRFVTTFAAWAYAVYLFHYPIMMVIHQKLLHGRLGVAALLELGVLSALVALPVAFVVHTFIERPFLILKEKHHDAGSVTSPAIANEVAAR